MKKITKLVLPIFILSLVIYSCNQNDDIDKTLNSEDNSIITIFERTSETLIPLNNGVFPDVDKVEKVGKKTKLGEKLIKEINSLKDYDLDYSNIKRITFSSVDKYTYSIPFNSNNNELIVLTDNNSISVVISKELSLDNGNKKFIINNYKNEPMMSLEQNSENKIGNRELYKSTNNITSFRTTSEFPKIKNDYLAKESDCLGGRSFSDCMQCAWDECSSSWVCGATLAFYPGPTIGFAAALCGLDTIANNI
jgi:hypothetical protein